MLLPIRFRSGGFRFATTPGYDLRSLRDQDYRPNLTISPTNIVTRVEWHAWRLCDGRGLLSLRLLDSMTLATMILLLSGMTQTDGL